MAEVEVGSATDGSVMALIARASTAQSPECHFTMLSSGQALLGRAVVVANVALATSARTLATS